ncbi:RxLR-like protein [Plasmopara halstedii]|uniref:RxLR-like protein n=1 Tax=Plasmopara halstedii TaxID=4781 RepID=A0A0P1B402_PLAHL|nr:RxLR-like protein [Plasmopara halstedii]CEG48134.1 RxLR-like protein [Plasmopara halstedii]|eukprot:XP_024584503.1 RxLR-like protein [Plasmopara halstedii]
MRVVLLLLLTIAVSVTYVLASSDENDKALHTSDTTYGNGQLLSNEAANTETPTHDDEERNRPIGQLMSDYLFKFKMMSKTALWNANKIAAYLKKKNITAKKWHRVYQLQKQKNQEAKLPDGSYVKSLEQEVYELLTASQNIQKTTTSNPVV